jgi:hypothetical protein
MTLFLIIALPIAFVIFVWALCLVGGDFSYHPPRNILPPPPPKEPISKDPLHESICETSEKLGKLLAEKKDK